MTISQEKLISLLERGDSKGCAALFVGTAEKDRRKLASTAQQIYKEYDKNEWKETSKNTFQFVYDATDAQREASRVAVFSTATLGELKKLRMEPLPEEELLMDLSRDLRPSWLPQLAEAVVEDSVWSWRLARRLVREGLCDRPTHDNYVLGMVSRGFTNWGRDKTIIDTLRADPDLLEREVWCLFEVEGGGEDSLAAHDKYSRPPHTWQHVLGQLSAEGTLSRQRLLERSLDALTRDFAQFRAGWYSRFHESLQPTLDEREALFDRYLSLLSSRIPPTVSFALKALKHLEKASRLPDRGLEDALVPVLSARQKGTVKVGLQMLSRLSRRTPDNSTRIAITITEALHHEAKDVQEAALKLLEAVEATTDNALTNALGAARAGIAASLRKRFESLISTHAPEDSSPATHSASSAQEESLVLEERTSTLDPSRAIEPIKSLEELVERYAFVLENPEETEELGRVLDGLFRLGAQPETAAEHLGPLRKRARDLLKRGIQYEHPVQALLASLAEAWIDQTTLEPIFDLEKNFWQYGYYDLLHQLVRRIAAHLRQNARAGLPLLSAPTHRRAWVSPHTLVDRLGAWQEAGHEPGGLDFVLALLRVAPEGRDAALDAAQRISGERGKALRYALGAEKITIGRNAAFWIAAARARAPFVDDPRLEARHPGLGPDAGLAARYEVGTTTRVSQPYTWHYLHVHVTPPLPKQKKLSEATPVPALHPTVRAHFRTISRDPDDWTGPGQAAGIHRSLVRWAFTVWPSCSGGLLAEGADRLGNNLDWDGAQWEDIGYLEVLLDPDVALQDMGRLVLTLGLATKEPTQRAMAIDVLLAALEDGRLPLDSGPSLLGETMAQLFDTGLIKMARWAGALAEVVPISLHHARFVARLIQRILRGDPTKAPRDLLKLLDVLLESLVEADDQLTDSDAIAYLDGIKRGGKTAKVKRELLLRRA